MRTLGTLALHVLREQVRSRTYLLVLIFGGAMVYATVLVGVLAVDQELRVLTDAGLALIELVVLAATVYAASTSILHEMESKTIYLLLARPIARWQYLLGRFLGICLAALLAVAAMGAVHLALLGLKGGGPGAAYPVFLLMAWLKVLVVGALAVLFALFSTSVLTAVVFTGFLWVLGHFLPEVSSLVRTSPSAASWILKPTLYLVPNLQLFNLRDRWEAPGVLVSPGTYLSPVAYAAVYVAIVLALALKLFQKKEF